MKIIIAAVILSATTNAFAQNSPCVKDLCIGDDIENRIGLNWMELSQRSLRQGLGSKPYNVEIQPASSWESARPYLTQHAFDKKGIKALSAIKADCTGNLGRLMGAFKSESGHGTLVEIELLPSDDGKTQVWRIVKITRVFKAAPSEAEGIFEQLKQQYPNALFDPEGRNSAGLKNVLGTDSNGREIIVGREFANIVISRETTSEQRPPVLYLYNRKGYPKESYSKHPMCKPKRINIE